MADESYSFVVVSNRLPVDRVVDEAGNALGTVAAVENFGAGDLLEVERPNGKRSLIPFREPIARLAGDRAILDPEFLA